MLRAAPDCAVHPPKDPPAARLRVFALQAIGGGIPGAAAMIIQVLALMWLRTVINYQYAHGGGFSETLGLLYEQGGVARLYQVSISQTVCLML